MQGIKVMSLESHKNYWGNNTNNNDYIYIPDFKVSPALTEPYKSSYYCIGLHLEGELIFHTNLARHELIAPSIILADKTTIKHWELTKANNRTQSILISESFIEHILASHNTFLFLTTLPYFGVFISKLEKDQLDRISALFEVINMHTPASTKLLTEVVRGAVYSLISYIGNLHSTEIKGANISTDYLFRFLSLVSDNGIKERNINFYANKIGIHTNYLGHLVKTQTGLTPGDWIKKQIILEAKINLQKPGLSVSDISDILGFPDQSSFGKYFKKHGGGISPLAYRELLKSLR